jgi:hypothetical protein
MAAPPAFLPYPSDLNDQEWAILAPLLPPPKLGGRPRTVDLGWILDGIFHVLRSGRQRASGGCCHGSTARSPPATATCALGVWTGRGSASTRHCANGGARRSGGSPRPV